MTAPLVTVAILAKQKESMLPAWLESLEQWDYPKERMQLWIRANNSTDKTNEILTQWVRKNVDKYHLIHMNLSDVEQPVQEYGVHEWNATRFKVLGNIRQESIEYSRKWADFYFVCDVDNFIRPHTLRKLVQMNLPVVAPFLKYANAQGEEDHHFYSNYHLIANERGYYQEDERYYTVWKQDVMGLIMCDVIHCTYLLRKDVLPYVQYLDDTEDYEYVIFSRNLRKQGIPQFLDNTEVGGYLTLHENVEAVTKAMRELK
jgi:glycosyltransferase involved in cell wall biosynthesis